MAIHSFSVPIDTGFAVGVIIYFRIMFSSDIMGNCVCGISLHCGRNVLDAELKDCIATEFCNRIQDVPRLTELTAIRRQIRAGNRLYVEWINDIVVLHEFRIKATIAAFIGQKFWLYQPAPRAQFDGKIVWINLFRRWIRILWHQREAREPFSVLF